MAMSTSKESLQQQIFKCIATATGNADILTSPKPILKAFKGDHAKTIFLSQLLYWSDKGKRKDGWFYKAYKEWEEELFISPYQIRKYTKEFELAGFIETKLKKVNNTPTVHYKVNPKAVYDWIVKKFDNRLLNNLTSDYEITSQSYITKTTAKTTTKTTKRNKGISGENSMSFKTFTKKNPESIILDDIIPAVDYYLASYRSYTGKIHPNLKENQWEKVAVKILYVESEHLKTYLELDELEKIVDKHFVTE